LKIHEIKELTFNDITQLNRNRLLWLDYGVDGLLTGWISDTGYHIIATAYQNSDRFIAVVMGASTKAQRENIALKLLNYGYKNFKTFKLSQENIRARVSVWKGIH
jgi:D-alanyl-D-alanine carboxypeptidase (penicillin-binding protein 5/6)